MLGNVTLMSIEMENVDKLAQKIWDYHRLNHKLEKADCIWVLGSHDARVAERGAQLFIESLAYFDKKDIKFRDPKKC